MYFVITFTKKFVPAMNDPTGWQKNKGSTAKRKRTHQEKAQQEAAKEKKKAAEAKTLAAKQKRGHRSKKECM